MEEIIYIGLLIVLAGIIALELGVPVAILEIIFGVLAFNVLGLETNQWIDFLADIGILGLMFFAGMEVDPDVLKKNFSGNISYGVIIYLLRLFAIFSVTFLLFGFSLEQSVLIGISLSTTSLALVYPIVRERGSIKTESGQMILSVAMVIDISSTTSLIYFVQPEQEVLLLLYIILSIAIFYAAPKISNIIFSRYGENIVEIEIRFIFLFLVVMGFLAERLAISEVVFAFFLGMIFSKILASRKDVEEKLRGIIFGFFAPVFFFKAGMLMDLRFLSVEVIEYLIVFGIVAYLSAFIFTSVIFKRKYGREIGKCAGFIFNFRLTFGIIAAMFGLRMGILSIGIYTVIVLIILLSSVASSIALRFIPPPAYIE